MLHIDIVTPESLLVSKPAQMVIVPGAEGDFGVLEFHAPLIATVRPGLVTVESENGTSEQYFVAGGMAEVTTDAKGSRCTVLAEEAKDLKKLNKKDAEERLRSAEKSLEIAINEAEKLRAETEINRARAMLSVVG